MPTTSPNLHENTQNHEKVDSKDDVSHCLFSVLENSLNNDAHDPVRFTQLINQIEEKIDQDTSITQIITYIIDSQSDYSDILSSDVCQKIQEFGNTIQKIDDTIAKYNTTKEIDFTNSQLHPITQNILSYGLENKEKINLILTNIQSFYNPEKWVTFDHKKSETVFQHPLDSLWSNDLDIQSQINKINDPDQREMYIYDWISTQLQKRYNIEDIYNHASQSNAERLISAQQKLQNNNLMKQEEQISTEQKTLLLLAHHVKGEELFQNTPGSASSKLRTLINGIDEKEIPSLIKKIMTDEKYISLKDTLQIIIAEDADIIENTLLDTEEDLVENLNKLLEKCSRQKENTFFDKNQALEITHQGYAADMPQVLNRLIESATSNRIGAAYGIYAISSLLSPVFDSLFTKYKNRKKSDAEKIVQYQDYSKKLYNDGDISFFTHHNRKMMIVTGIIYVALLSNKTIRADFIDQLSLITTGLIAGGGIGRRTLAGNRIEVAIDKRTSFLSLFGVTIPPKLFSSIYDFTRKGDAASAIAETSEDDGGGV